ncbi:MAG: hypothetical protein K6E69_09720 [Treponema sp.]|uniref:hypothetical protein n=1 Tax=Treponema sp. TaxID=166 RepID=UPI00298E03A2|nr:hypothetical protein [Treponema sp.]MCR5387384.1 hypothetical protein [Treponema sp.]
MKKTVKKLVTILAIFMASQMLFAQSKNDKNKEKDIRIVRSEEICKIIPLNDKPLKRDTVTKFSKYISDKYAQSITIVQYNNIIKMFYLKNSPVDENTSVEEKKFILSYFLLQKYRQDETLVVWDKLIEDNTTAEYKTIISDLPNCTTNKTHNDIYITWIEENGSWYICEMSFHVDAPLYMREVKFDYNRDHVRKVFIAPRHEELVTINGTLPLPATEENLEKYYPGLSVKWERGRTFNFEYGVSWQMTDVANYFFCDAGVGTRFNIFFGDNFSLSPEIAAIAKLNLVTSDPAAGIVGEAGMTFHITSASGADFFGIRTFYQHSFIFPFRKESDSFNFGAVGLGFYLNLKNFL